MDGRAAAGVGRLPLSDLPNGAEGRLFAHAPRECDGRAPSVASVPTLHHFFRSKRPRARGPSTKPLPGPEAKRARDSASSEASSATMLREGRRAGEKSDAGRAARLLSGDMNFAASTRVAASPCTPVVPRHRSDVATSSPRPGPERPAPVVEDPSQTTLLRFFRVHRSPLLALPFECQLHTFAFLAPPDLMHLRATSRRTRVPAREIRRAAARAARLDPDFEASLQQRDAAFLVHPYMESQAELQPRMRAIVVDWLLDVAELYMLAPATLHLAVGILDRYLQLSPVPRTRLQLAGLAAMLIAMKHEERPGTLADLADLTAGAYTAVQLAAMEREFLRALDFRFYQPTVVSFTGLFCRLAGEGDEVVEFTGLYADAALHSYELAFAPRRVVAAACICIARQSAGRAPWSPRLEAVSGVRYSDPRLWGTAEAVLSMARREGCMEQLFALRSKYRSQRQAALWGRIQIPPALSWPLVAGVGVREPAGGNGDGADAGRGGDLETPSRPPAAGRAVSTDARAAPNPPPPPHRVEPTDWRALHRPGDARAGGTGISPPTGTGWAVAAAGQAPDAEVDSVGDHSELSELFEGSEEGEL